MKAVRLLLVVIMLAFISAPVYAGAARGVACDVLMNQILNTEEPGNSLMAHCNAYQAPGKCPFDVEIAQVCAGVQQVCDELLDKIEVITAEFAKVCNYDIYKYAVELIDKFDAACFDKETTIIIKDGLVKADKACQLPTCIFQKDFEAALGWGDCQKSLILLGNMEKECPATFPEMKVKYEAACKVVADDPACLPTYTYFQEAIKAGECLKATDIAKKLIGLNCSQRAMAADVLLGFCKIAL